MTRPSFSTTITGSVERTTGYPPSQVVSSDVGPAMYAMESVSGVHRRRPTGFLPPTSYSFRRDKYVGPFGIVQLNDGGQVIYRGWLGNGSTRSAFNILNVFERIYPWTDAPASYHQDRALVRARMAMKQQNVNLGVAFAERSQTARLVGDTALSLARSVTALRHGQWRRAANALGITNPKRAPRGSNLPQKWLELQYGWKPLLSDVHGAVAALAKRPTSDWRVTGKGSSREVLVVPPINGQLTPGLIQSNGTGRFEGHEGCFVRIDAIPADNPALHDLASLGITNPLEIAWELIPYSFVVDWFLPVGNYLSSLDAMLGYGPTTCSITLMKRGKYTAEGRSGKYGVTTVTQASWGARRDRVALTRSVSNSVPLPSRPRFKDPRSFGHMANALSLLAGAFGRH